VRVASATAPQGTVLSQVPPAGSPAVPNARVHRLVSAGPARVAWIMPDLSGRSRDTVEGWAERSGFRVAVRSVSVGGRSAGTVVGQFPLAGYPIRDNDVVELTIAR
jgi:beta-lactam-binding protein with PASTA domain